MDEKAEAIVVNIDAYGTKGRATCLADYVEYCTLIGETINLSHLADLVSDHGWGRRDLDLINSSSTFDEWEDEVTTELPKFESDEPDVVARVGQLLLDRQSHLGESYPFTMSGEGPSTKLTLKEGDFEDAQMCYLSLLAFTLAHSFSVQVPNLASASVEDAFEDYVAHTFEQHGLRAAVVPTYGEALEAKIPKVASPLGLRPQVSLAAFSKKAKDGGTDIVCHTPATDPRYYPCFLFLGQATCGQTETWESKANQTSTAAWRKMLLMDYDPHSFLAVPHHVDPRHWRLLSQESGTPIVDRVRLLSMNQMPTEDGRTAARHVFRLGETEAEGPDPGAPVS